MAKPLPSLGDLLSEYEEISTAEAEIEVARRLLNSARDRGSMDRPPTAALQGIFQPLANIHRQVRARKEGLFKQIKEGVQNAKAEEG